MNEVNYYFGNGNYKDVLACMATTKVNSYKTSSLPLAQFWNPANKELSRFLVKCNKEGLDISLGNRYFEYPTPCVDYKGEELLYSYPSMTDLMILNEAYQVAIEAKYTEYSESHYETIAEWLGEGLPHKKAIKQRWFDYITECGATNKTILDESIPYQFLHRTASACYKCENRKPVLIYQLFYDKENAKKKNEFVEQLEMWAHILGLTDKIRFMIIEVEIKNIDDVKLKYDGIRSDLFLIMRKVKEIYLFDWDNIKIRDIKL